MSKKVLIVDDEKAIVDILNHNLKREGYETFQAYDGEDAVNQFREKNPDLILLDVMLPKIDGFSVCKIIRQTTNIPIIMVTAKEDVVDKVIGLEIGADDYISKPFSVREVLARVKANLRKWDGIEASLKTSEDKHVLTLGPLTIDSNRYEAKICGKSINITNREFELLKFLATQPGQVFSRDELLKNVWRYDFTDGDQRTVDVTMSRLREKIEREPNAQGLLGTKRGVGYYLNIE
mgnify:CR=1 FL=1